MNIKRLAALLAGLACVATLAGCATNDQGNLVVDPNKVNAIIAGALTPPPPPSPVVVEEAYVPGHNDVYIAAVEERDVVVVSGDTFIWYVGPDGHPGGLQANHAALAAGKAPAPAPIAKPAASSKEVKKS
jgi:hypothetical protein